MSRPRYLYEVEEKELILRADDAKSCTIQQGDVLGRENTPDSHIFLNRENAVGLRAALDQWLKETE